MKASGFLKEALKLSKIGTRQLLVPALFTIVAFSVMGANSLSAETIIHDNSIGQTSIQLIDPDYSHHISP
ncbi:MAG: hypothetical protein L3J04_06270 [Robiginitomaculum sp.]|nr:hypothetical protein [Robiginitomaculum sp.]